MSYIVLNQIRCRKCDDVIFSRDVHNFVTCYCGAVSVDGGQDYLRRVGDQYEDQSIVIRDSEWKELMNVMEWCAETNRNEKGIVCAIMRKLDELDLLKLEDFV